MKSSKTVWRQLVAPNLYPNGIKVFKSKLETKALKFQEDKSRD